MALKIQMRETELAIIGAGVAGLTAAMTAARHGLEVLVVERLGAGGQIMNVERIDDFPGFPDGIAGIELGPRLQEQAEAAGAAFALDQVEALTRRSDGRHVLCCADEDIAARAVVIATGSARRRLGIPGEELLTGRGVSECAGCDGPLFGGQVVGVVGGGDSAFSEALALARHVQRIHVIFRASEPHAQHVLVEALRACDNVEFHPGCEVFAIHGETAVEGLLLRSRAGDDRLLEVRGVFVYAGLKPESGFAGNSLELDDEGRIVADDSLQTSLPGVFVAGDIRSGAPFLLATAAGEGAHAALSALAWLRRESPDREEDVK